MRDLLTMQERLESLFGRAAPGWVPPVDLFERPDRYVLTRRTARACAAKTSTIEGNGETVVVQRPAARPGLLPRALPAARARPGPLLAVVPICPADRHRRHRRRAGRRRADRHDPEDAPVGHARSTSGNSQDLSCL